MDTDRTRMKTADSCLLPLFLSVFHLCSSVAEWSFEEPLIMRNRLDGSITRRELMQLSAAGVAGASLSGWFGLLAEHARAAAPPARLKSCVLLWMDGGPSHHDTFDPKPDASSEYRGE